MVLCTTTGALCRGVSSGTVESQPLVRGHAPLERGCHQRDERVRSRGPRRPFADEWCGVLDYDAVPSPGVGESVDDGVSALGRHAFLEHK